ncbi:ATP-dependent DNA helicase RecG [Lapidilactobacillus dextrinicus DSM 20335]|uniref:ATP-dependent DNA helicase RecG n=1 Tax=Lapidilactobacillus dextrinicus DSM 20335 TaxID=1423738 RepID=A0A0R2BK56_9LACO|nr:ATP-dependent DNA helicase RecG [Lapidilactobacillus dextrinicus]KRM79703.1 ATP-dependent DNA helicase RecG [Lapidilactobacillus dextrinicus DSM 20335]QFG47064.1 ATP-dependent DNA helicase RecG [Lapidilactobacillus dextrinicus]
MARALTDSVAVLSGVGPKTVAALATLDINTVNDLLFYFPFRYEDLQTRPLAELADQEKAVFKGKVVSNAVVSFFGPHKNRLSVRLLIDGVVVIVTFFNQAWLKDKFKLEEEVAIYGKWNEQRKSVVGMKIISQSTDNALDPIYSVNKQVRQKKLVELIQTAFKNYGALLGNVLPDDIRQHFRLLTDHDLVQQMHFPKTLTESNAARRTAIFREFFLFEAKIQQLRVNNSEAEDGLQLSYDLPALKEFIATLPFALTTAQKRVVNEICADLKSTRHMNRLLQGDVGSGKTIVAAIAMFAAVTAGYQAALMVPTEILAEQHYQKLVKLFAPMKVSVTLLTGSMKSKPRQNALMAIETGRANIIIGTHALIQDAITFHKLGFIVIDEQHRFGVNQRRALREKGLNPDILAMTATPIPRTLAITTYGEMDISTIDELPAGRRPIETSWLKINQASQALAITRNQMDHGDQAFVIAPLISESDSVNLKNAEDLAEQLADYFAPKYQVALLHGQMTAEEKAEKMAAFNRNDIQVLVATTVVEVGVDVPNANIMIIYNADRFGLATLHQLRGRVGRGDRQAYCFLIADPQNEVAVKRMEIMTETNDGFKLAEADLKLRGQGDIFGDKQSGLPDFQMGDPVSDNNILVAAHQVARELFLADPQLVQEQNQGLKNYLRQLQATETFD